MDNYKRVNDSFTEIYNKSYKLAAAIFVVSDLMDKNEELRTKVRSLSIDLISASVLLRNANVHEIRQRASEVERVALLLMSILEIASVTRLISEMNAGLIRKEFESFLSELSKFSGGFENRDFAYLKNVFGERTDLISMNRPNVEENQKMVKPEIPYEKIERSDEIKSDFGDKNGNGYKRKDMRRTAIVNFIKRHNNISIKDIAQNIVGCSEKTVQRELISLVSQGVVKKVGERRWSRYSIV